MSHSILRNLLYFISTTPLHLKLNLSYQGLFLYCPHNLGQFMGLAGIFIRVDFSIRCIHGSIYSF